MHHITDHLHHSKGHETDKKKSSKTTAPTTTKTTTAAPTTTSKVEHTKQPESKEFKKVEPTTKSKKTEEHAREALSSSDKPHKHAKESGYDKDKPLKHTHEGHTHTHEAGHTHTHTHTPPVTHTHAYPEGHERHITHERSAMKPDEYGNMYRSGTDPLMNREIGCETHDKGAVIREIVSDTPIVKEIVQPVELHKVQPVVHREREQKEIRHVYEPHKEYVVQDTEIIHADRDIDLGIRREPSTLETTRSVGVPHIEPTREFVGIERQHQDLPVRVEEHVHKVVEEHVHPVIYKEVLKPKVLEETHHIYEKVKEAPIETFVDRGLDRGISTHDMLDEAKREFFAHESARAIPCPIHQQGHLPHEQHLHHHNVQPTHVHEKREAVPSEHKPLKEKLQEPIQKKKKKKKPHKAEKQYKPKVSEPFNVQPTTHAEPVIGHHQNIGAHHLPSTAVPMQQQGSIYDAALAQSAVEPHSARDVGLVQKMDDKKLAEKEARRTGLTTTTPTHNVV